MKRLLFGASTAAILAIPLTGPAFASPPTLSFDVTKRGAPQVLADIGVMLDETETLACSASCTCAQTHTAMLITARGLVAQMNAGEMTVADMSMTLKVADDGTRILEVNVDGAVDYLTVDDELMNAAQAHLDSFDTGLPIDGHMAAMPEPARITRHRSTGLGSYMMGQMREFTQFATARMSRFTVAQAEGMSMQPV